MTTIHTLGYPRIGAQRELKFALESFWKGASAEDDLRATGRALRQRHWAAQRDAGLDFVTVGDFAWYDQVLQTAALLGAVPTRFGFDAAQLTLAQSFVLARGNANHAAMEMTKWFDTNYHYIVPEFAADTAFKLDASRLVEQLAEARAQGVRAKPVIIGPVTYLALGKAKDESDKLALLSRLLPVYAELLAALAAQGVEWVQIDEPVLVTELAPELQDAFRTAYAVLAKSPVKLLLATYFGQLQENLPLVAELPVQGVHLDAINARQEVAALIAKLPADRVVSLGVINGRNIWKTDLNGVLDWLEPVAKQLGDRLWIAPSCSLLHVPVDLNSEQKLDADVKSWLAFALQKLEELKVLAVALRQGREAAKDALSANRAAIDARIATGQGRLGDQHGRAGLEPGDDSPRAGIWRTGGEDDLHRRVGLRLRALQGADQPVAPPVAAGEHAQAQFRMLAGFASATTARGEVG